ncbi:MAG: glycosyltransferase family 1 protein [Sutterella sp.]|nr:glycosyltransferase family 1 protein [Sutterella sp.]
MSNKIWINVTTSKQWRGPVVGIVRTEIEIVKQLLALYTDEVKLCEKTIKGFIEVSIEEYTNKYTREEKDSKPKKKYHNKKNLLTEYIARLNRHKKEGNLLWHIIPKPFRKLFYTLGVKPNNTKIYYENNNKNIDLSIFNEGDTFISLGLDWDYGISQQLWDIKHKRKTNIVTICYDLIPIKYPQYVTSGIGVNFSEHILECAQASDLMLCISERTKEDLSEYLDYLGCRKPDIKTIELGSHETVLKKEAVRPEVSNILNEKFILYVSTIERRKNHEVLYKAYHKLLASGKTSIPKLIFVGMKGWLVEELLHDINNDPLIQDYIFILGRVNDYELELLYQKCQFTVFPSLYEGWGLGVSESLRRGKFVLSSSSGSLPEAGKKYASYIDPWDVNEWVKQIEYYSSNASELETKNMIIKQDYISVSWENTAKSIYGLLFLISNKNR